MFDIFKLSWFEYKKIFCRKGFLICMIIIFFMLLMFVGNLIKLDPTSLNNMPKFKIKDPAYAAVMSINFSFSSVANLIIFFQAVTIISEEFRHGTTYFLFTGTKSRTEILLSKNIAMLLFCLTFGFLDYILIYYYKISTGQKDFLNYIYIISMYFVFSWFISNYFSMFAIIFKSRVVSIVTGLFFLFVFSDVIFILDKSLTKSSILKPTNKILDLLPFGHAFNFLIDNQINQFKIYGLIIGGLIFFIISAFILERKDI